MGKKDQNIALVCAKKCLMGEKNNRVHVLVHTLWATKKSENSFPDFLVQAHKKSKNIIIINNHYYYHYQYHYFSPAAASSSQLPSHAS